MKVTHRGKASVLSTKFVLSTLHMTRSWSVASTFL